MEIMRLRRGEAGAGEGFDSAGFYVDDAVLVLHHAFDREEGLFADSQAVLLEDLRGDDDVGGAAFVFEADEDEAFCGAGALAADDESADPHERSAFGLLKLGGEPKVGEFFADEGHRVCAGGEADGAVVGVGALDGRHGRERQRGGGFGAGE